MTAYIGRGVPLFEDFIGSSASVNTAVMDGSGDIIGGLFKADRAGTIDRIESWITGITGTAPFYDGRLETIVAGDPSNTLLGTNTNLVWQPAGTGVQSLTLTAPHVVAVGDIFATTIRYSSGTIDGSNSATFRLRLAGAIAPSATFPQWSRSVSNLTAGSFTMQNCFACVVPRYSDGRYPSFIALGVTVTTNTFNSGTTPDEISNRFTCPHNVLSHGARALVSKTVAGSNYDIILYDSASNVLASRSVVADTEHSGSTINYQTVYWSSPVRLRLGQDYRIAVKPTTTNNMRVYEATYTSEDARRSMSFEQIASRRTDGGSWTDDVTGSLAMSVLVDDYPAMSARARHLIGI